MIGDKTIDGILIYAPNDNKLTKISEGGEIGLLISPKYPKF